MRVIIAEDSTLLRSGLTRLLQDEGIEIVADVDDDERLFAVLEKEPDIDLCVVDIRMPPTYTDEGMRAAVRIRNERPDVAVLLLSQHVVGHYAAQLLSGGAAKVGYLLKDRVADIDDFLQTLRRVARGGTAIDPEVVAQLLSGDDGSLSTLSPRETEVLGSMAEGLNNAGVAARLWISERAVEKHIRSIFTKLGLGHHDHHHRRVQAVLHYLKGADAPRPGPPDNAAGESGTSVRSQG
jgi:DNA-binding NarL/FixJ family response regulator